MEPNVLPRRMQLIASGVQSEEKFTMNQAVLIEKDVVLDIELVDLVKNRDEKAFEQLVGQYAPRMYQTAYSILGSHQDAEEVVQDALLRAYRALPQFRGESSLLTWLYRIVINQSHNKYQWNKRRGSIVNCSMSKPPEEGSSEEQEDFTIPDGRYAPERTFSNKELGLLVKREIEQLPEALKETMIMRYLSELSYEEIAEIQSCRLGTIKSRLSRGREILIERLKRSGIALPCR